MGESVDTEWGGVSARSEDALGDQGEANQRPEGTRRKRTEFYLCAPAPGADLPSATAHEGVGLVASLQCRTMLDIYCLVSIFYH